MFTRPTNSNRLPLCQTLMLFASTGLLLGCLSTAQGGTIDIVDEHFNTNSFPGSASGDTVSFVYNAGISVLWDTSDTGYEQWGSGGAGARGLQNPPDGDESGLEIIANNAAAPTTIDVSFDLPTGQLVGDISFSFDASNRIVSGTGGSGQSVSVRNVTQGFDLLAATGFASGAGNPPRSWSNNAFSLDPLTSAAGDTIRIRFISDDGAGAPRTHELDAVFFSVNLAAPEPSTFVLAVFGLMSLGLRRRRSARK